MHKISNEIIEDLNFWKSKINKQKDIELYNAIIVILKNIQVNTNTLSDKNMQDQKIGKSAERWAIIGTNDSVETQNRIENYIILKISFQHYIEEIKIISHQTLILLNLIKL